MSYRRFVLISHLRSGTHMVRTALDSHPAVVCQGEPFNANSPRLPYSLETSVEQILSHWVFPQDLPSEIKMAGFVLHLYHPGSLKAFPYLKKNERWNSIWTILSRDPELSVVFLSRRNLLLRHLSQVLARSTGFWHSWRGDMVHRTTHLESPPPKDFVDTDRPRVPKQHLDLQRLLTDFEEIRDLQSRARQLFSHQRCHYLVYEDLCAAPDKAFQELQQFLGVPQMPISPATRRLENRLLSEAVSNYDEIREGLSGTEWSSFLHETSPQDRTPKI